MINTKEKHNQAKINRNMIVKTSTSIREGFKILDENAREFSTLFVLSDDNKMIGTFEFSDFRRGVLYKNIELDNTIGTIMQKDFKWIKEGEVLSPLQKIKLQRYKYLPVLNNKNEVVEILIIESNTKLKENSVVIMAGGQGKRLQPLTLETPKPMLKIDEFPMIHWIVNRFQNQGFTDIHISVNYMKEVIKDYFNENNNTFPNLTFIEEEKKLGTAGHNNY